MRSGSSDPKEFFQDKSIRATERHLATHLFAQAVAQPHGVNEETPPDYEQMAKYALARATETAPYLLRELGLLPKEGE